MSVFQDAVISPDDVVVGQSHEFAIRLTVGAEYPNRPTRIVYDFPGQLGFSRPTRLHHELDGYLQAYVSNPRVGYDVRLWNSEAGQFISRDYMREGNPNRAASVRHAVLDLDAGLAQGDTVTLLWGETGMGFGPGTKVTTVAPRPDFRCTLEVRWFDSQEKGMPDYGRDWEGYERPRPDESIDLSFRVRPQAPCRLRLLRRPDKAQLVVADLFHNQAETESHKDLVEGPQPDGRNPFGVSEYADRNVQIASRNLPMTVSPDMIDVWDGYNIYWGDIHTHSAFSNDCIERARMDMTPHDLMGFARHRAGLDYYAVTDHHQPWDKPRNHVGRTRWERTMEALEEHDAPGQFLVYAGIEYRCPRGDTALVFNWSPEYDELMGEDLTDIRKMWERLQGRDYLGIAHFHNPGKLPDGEWWQNVASGIEPVLEIFSCHGSYEREDALEHRIPLIKQSRPDRYGAHFLEQGLRYGLVANSDDHKGHVGVHGITAAYAKSLDKDAIFEAYRARRVYATTNARIRLVFTANGAPMGSILENTADKALHIDVAGEAPLKKIEVFRNGAPYRLWPGEGAMRFQNDLNIDEDAPSFWYVRATQLDNHTAWSSPIWFDQADGASTAGG